MAKLYAEIKDTAKVNGRKAAKASASQLFTLLYVGNNVKYAITYQDNLLQVTNAKGEEIFRIIS